MIKQLQPVQHGEKDLFRRIDFAVLDRTGDQYNFREFYRNFGVDEGSTGI